MKSKKTVNLILTLMLIICVILLTVSCNNSKTKIDKSINETFNVEGFDITVLSYKFKRYAKGGSYEADKNKIWLIIEVKVANNSSNALYIDTITTSVVYNNNGEEASYNSSFCFDDYWIMSNTSFSPYYETTGMLTYQVPEKLSTQTDGACFELHIQKNKQKISEYYSVKLQ